MILEFWNWEILKLKKQVCAVTSAISIPKFPNSKINSVLINRKLHPRVPEIFFEVDNYVIFHFDLFFF